jgi:hypothetical protein
MVPVGHTATQRSQSTQSPAPALPMPRGSPRDFVVTDDQRVVVEGSDCKQPYGQSTTHNCSRKRGRCHRARPRSRRPTRMLGGAHRGAWRTIPTRRAGDVTRGRVPVATETNANAACFATARRAIQRPRCVAATCWTREPSIARARCGSTRLRGVPSAGMLAAPRASGAVIHERESTPEARREKRVLR